MLASCDLTSAPAEDGIDYTFTNRCDAMIFVEVDSAGDGSNLAPGSSQTIHTTDEEPMRAFVVANLAGTWQVEFTVTTATFDIEGEHCPA